MKLKSLVVVVLILAVLSAVVLWTSRPAPERAADPRVGKPMIDPSVIDAAAKLRITDQGKTVVLSRQPDATWRDDTYYGMPADFSKLSSFVSDVTAAKLDRLVTTNPDRISHLEFNGSKIELLDAADHPLAAVDLGKNADQGGKFVKFGAEPKAYQASLNAWLDTDPKSWADANLLALKADDIAKVEIGFEAGKPVVATRTKKDSPWEAESLPAGQQIKADKVASVISTLSALRFSDTSDLKDAQAVAAKDHSRTFRLTTFDGKTYTIVLGRKPEEKKLKAMPTTPVDLKKDGKIPPPEFDTIPAGPVYAWVTSSDPRAPVNALMKKRAFQIDEYNYTGLPQKPDELTEPAPKPAAAPAPKPEKKP